jgi:hypothetical protein
MKVYVVSRNDVVEGVFRTIGEATDYRWHSADYRNANGEWNTWKIDEKEIAINDLGFNVNDVKIGLEIAARVLEMRLENIKSTNINILNRRSVACKRRAINEMQESIEHVRNFKNVEDMLSHALTLIKMKIIETKDDENV